MPMKKLGGVDRNDTLFNKKPRGLPRGFFILVNGLINYL